MKVTVKISKHDELVAWTSGYQGQPAEIVVPPFVTAVTAALQRLQQRPHASVEVSTAEPADGDEQLGDVPANVVAHPPLAAAEPESAAVAEPDEQAWRRAVAEDLVAGGAAAVVTSGVTVAAEPEHELAPGRRARRGRPSPVAAAERRSTRPAAHPRHRAEDVERLDQLREQALRMLDDDELPEVIADQLGVTVRLVKAWDRGDR